VTGYGTVIGHGTVARGPEAPQYRAFILPPVRAAARPGAQEALEWLSS
jgi:hypothetical protein